jgi:biotin carboxyl carrier protein
VKYEIRIGDKPSTVELEREAAQWKIAVDGQSVAADAIELSPGVFSILLDGSSHEVRVSFAPDGTLRILSGLEEFSAEVVDSRSWRGRRHGELEAAGRQPVAAPMPGKVVRVLRNAGEKVEAGEGILVVEAMKMQNEIRSPKSGVVERMLVKEGQAVNSGETLAWIE